MRKKRTYLFRLMAIIVLGVLLPMLLFFEFFWKHSFSEMEKSNQAYYSKVLDSFSDNFQEKLADLKWHASGISANSKEPDSVFGSGSESFCKSPYWYYEAMQELQEFSDHNVSACGIYYYELDCIITVNGTQTAEQYISGTLGIKDTDDEIQTYFAEENYGLGKTVFATTNRSDSNNGALMVGICTIMGRKQDRVMIFYIINPNDYEDSMSVVYGNSGIHFYVLEEDAGQVYLALGEAASENTMIGEIERESSSGGIRQQRVYQKKSEEYPLNYMIYITDDSLQSNITIFYYEMRTVLWVTIVLLIFSCVGALYIAYKPVYRLMTDLDYHEGDEFEIIRNTIDDHHTRLREQEMLIMDLLLKHLIQGMPISKERIKRLGISTDIRYYSVFVLEGHVLLTGEVEALTAEIEKRFDVRLFATDWQGENRTILITFLKKMDVSEVEEWLLDWLETNLAEYDALYAGKLVDRPDDIRSSLLSCLEKKEEWTNGSQAVDKQSIKDEVKALNARKEQQKQMKDMVLAYLEVHYRDVDLSQTTVADAFKISNYTLSRMFKNQVGIGFTEYVNAKRLEYAKELLLTTTYSVREISVMVGYANDNYFTRIFKANVGVAPTVFREK